MHPMPHAHQRGRTTYNEVADALVDELQDDPESGGDDKNIRRRVYDALNVLQVTMPCW